MTFGDSYTDVVNVNDGGVAWPTYVASYASVALHAFARSGATCSSSSAPPDYPYPFPVVVESQIPTFQNASGDAMGAM